MSLEVSCGVYYTADSPLLETIQFLYIYTESSVCIAGSKSDLLPVKAGCSQGCPLSLVLFITFMDRHSGCSQLEDSVRIRGLPFSAFCRRNGSVDLSEQRHSVYGEPSGLGFLLVL